MSSVPNLESVTPMMKQYYQLKEKCHGAILLFRMGDFYEIFGEDAELVAPKLELVLTSRERGDQKKIPFCGVPHHSARSYWLKLINMGYSVAFADQIEDPKESKGLVKRDITKIITPGTLIELEGLVEQKANYLLSIYEEPTTKKWGLALADVSTGEMRIGSVTGLVDVVGIIEKYQPQEILARRFIHDEVRNALRIYEARDGKIILSELSEEVLRDKKMQSDFYRSVAGSNPDSKLEAGTLEALAGLVCFLKERFVSVDQFVNIKPLFDSERMVIDSTAIRDLEIFETSRSQKTVGSLFHEINCTFSPMGARLLRTFILKPLMNKEEISKRHLDVKFLVENANPNLEKILAMARGFPDIERLFTKVLSRTIRPNELGLIREALKKSCNIMASFAAKQCPANLDRVFQSLGAGDKIFDLLDSVLDENPSQLGSGKGVFRFGMDEALDKLSDLASGGQTRVDSYESELRKETGISSLKIKKHKTFGLLIEVTKSNLAKVPDHFIRKQTMVNNERFITEDLEELSVLVNSATDELVAREIQIYDDLLANLAQKKKELYELSRAIAYFDVVFSFAYKAKESGYCCPNLSQRNNVKLRASRHPVVEGIIGRYSFVPNDILISSDCKHLLITGPNMAGKSTIMRQLAISALLCQIGSYVPAVEAELPIFDRIFTRVGASDDLSQGLSTFLVEMKEAAQILRHASAQSLVILDEVGRGTSTSDGLAIATAILENIVKKIDCWSLFATHYHEIVPFAKELGRIRLVQTQVEEVGQEVNFTHRLIEGASGHSYGIEVAKIAGIPESVIARAKYFLKTNLSSPLKNSSLDEVFAENPPLDDGFKTMQMQQLSRKIMDLRLHKTTPIQALNFLNDLKLLIKSESPPSLFSDD